MATISKEIRHALRYGPGGMNCTCCFEAPNSKARRKKFKSAKNRVKRKAIKETLSEI